MWKIKRHRFHLLFFVISAFYLFVFAAIYQVKTDSPEGRLWMLMVLQMLGLLVLYFTIMYYRTAEKLERFQQEMLNEARMFNATLIDAALSKRSLEQELEDALQGVLSISWLSVQSKGSIFLTDEVTGELLMTTQKDLAQPLLFSCARLQPGQCLCGRAAKTGQTVFKNCVDHEHEITFQGMTPHGHICVPIKKSAKVLGVLNLYVNHGYVMKPYQQEILDDIAASLAILIETKTIHEDLKEMHFEISRQHNELVYEREIIENTLLKIRSSEKFDESNIRYLDSPVEKTAGDILLSSACDDGRHLYMLGDFTGHGLPSALSGPAVADIFYAMSRKNVAAVDILSEINRKLALTLPVHLYMAACLVEYDQIGQKARIWNAGLPAVIHMRDGQELQRYPSGLFPMGITEDVDFSKQFAAIDVLAGDRLYVHSDGIIEASDFEQKMFGMERLVNVLRTVIAENLSLDFILEELARYSSTGQQEDDITLLEINI